MNIIGDIHGDFEFYLSEIKDLDSSIQIGDYGITCLDHRFDMLNHGDMQHRCIAGNHDRRFLMESHFNTYLGHYGYLEQQDIFYVSGAYTPAWAAQCLPENFNIAWFPEEELNSQEILDCIKLYEQIRPRFVVSHTAPYPVASRLLRTFNLEQGNPLGCRTEIMLNKMFSIHQPEKWYFGHFHVSYETELFGTRFRCVNINEVVQDADIPNF